MTAPGGPAELRELFKSFADRISFSQHNVFNPRITVNGNEAHGTWYFLGPFTSTLAIFEWQEGKASFSIELLLHGKL